MAAKPETTPVDEMGKTFTADVRLLEASCRVKMPTEAERRFRIALMRHILKRLANCGDEISHTARIRLYIACTDIENRELEEKSFIDHLVINIGDKLELPRLKNQPIPPVGANPVASPAGRARGMNGTEKRIREINLRRKARASYRVGKRVGQDRWQIKESPGWRVATQVDSLLQAAGWLGDRGVDLSTVPVLDSAHWKSLAEHVAIITSVGK